MTCPIRVDLFVGGVGEASTVIDKPLRVPVLTDGPCPETKEFVIGFWIMEAPDLDAVTELAAEG